MGESPRRDHGETPAVTVRVYRHGRLWLQEVCESENAAAVAIEEWSELEGVTCEVDDLSIRHRPGDILAPEPPEPDTEGYDARIVEPAAPADRRS